MTLDTGFCYEDAPSGYTRTPATNQAWERCDHNQEEEVSHECGVMCTIDEEVCLEKVGEQTESTTRFIFDLSTQNYVGAVGSGANTAEAFANAKCS